MSDNVEVTPESSETAAVETETVATETVAVETESAPVSEAPLPVVDDVDDVAVRASRKFREGVVVSTGMEKTIVVSITERVRHRRYQRTVQRTKKLYVDDQEGSAKVGDSVRVVETRPLSKLKRWRLVEVLERAR